MVAEVRGAEGGSEEERMVALRERMEGMPGSMPIDREIREQRVSGVPAAMGVNREALGVL